MAGVSNITERSLNRVGAPTGHPSGSAEKMPSQESGGRRLEARDESVGVFHD